MLPSVTMKGTTIRRVMSTPLSSPRSAPAPTPARAALGADPTCFMTNAAITEDSAMLAPTDRSMPPLTMTKVMPIAESPTMTRSSGDGLEICRA